VIGEAKGIYARQIDLARGPLVEALARAPLRLGDRGEHREPANSSGTALIGYRIPGEAISYPT
jgi:hypothetical protein